MGKSVAAVAVMAAVLLAPAATAHADDAGFLNAVHGNVGGIPDDKALMLGHYACAEMAKNGGGLPPAIHPISPAVHRFIQHYGGLTEFQAGVLEFDARDHLCPGVG